jgi:hypothetical protein
MKPLPVAPGNNGIGTGEGTQNALVMDRKRGEGYDMGSTTGTGHHYGRDAAVGAGGVGLAEHERRKHERERNDGLGSSTTPGTTAAAGPHSVSHVQHTSSLVLTSLSRAFSTSSTLVLIRKLAL